MTRRIFSAVIFALACAGALPAQAAPTVGYTVQGTIKQSCSSAPTTPSGNLTISANSGNGNWQSFGAINSTIPYCNGATNVTLAISTTALQNIASGQQSDRYNYTPTLTGWPTSTGTISVSTNETSSTPVSPRAVYTSSAVARSRPYASTAISVTSDKSTIKNLSGVSVTKGTNGATYSAVVTIILSVTP